MHINKKLPQDNYSARKSQIDCEAERVKVAIGDIYKTSKISKEEVELFGSFLRNYLEIEPTSELSMIKQDIYKLIKNIDFSNTPATWLPCWIQNESPNGNKVCPKKFYWTGLLLHMYGFSNLEYLDYGGESVVWADKKNGYVYKVNYVKDQLDQKNNQRIHLLQNSANVNGKVKKYLSDVLPFDNNLIIKCELCKNYIENSKDFYNDFYNNKTKNLEYLDQFLCYAKNIVKALEVLHSKGYSFNDLKPENLLIKEKSIEKFKDKYGYLPLNNYNSESGELYQDPDNKFTLNKYRINLTDYSSLTSLSDEYLHQERKINITDQYVSSNDVLRHPISAHCYSQKEMESARKRDVYAMGVTLTSMLFRMKYDHPEYSNIVHDMKTYATYQYSHDISSLIDSYWDSWLKHVYQPCEEWRAKKILGLIIEMLSEDPYKRPDYQQVLDRLQDIQNKKC